MKTEGLHPVEREHVWTYFQLHAQQRLTAFNFYIVLSAALIAASAALLKTATGVPYALVPLGGAESSVICPLEVGYSQQATDKER